LVSLLRSFAFAFAFAPRQHWYVYRKWNTRLFEEMYDAYRLGRIETDPSENWYNTEKSFFDFYIIPLAKKLKECGIFGVSSDEYLQFAQQNRQEWELKGQDIVAEMLEKASSKRNFEEKHGALATKKHESERVDI
jgi:hypothetical protein